MDVPWFMLSPSPVSFIQYAVLTWIMWSYFSRVGKYRKYPRLMSLLDAFSVVIVFVCITDAVWVSLTIWRWLPFHPDSALQIFSSLGRDIVGALVFLLMIWDHFKNGNLDFMSSSVFWLGVCAAAQFVWFAFSPSQIFTDYIWAYKSGSDIGIII